MLYSERTGSGETPPVVLLHGFGLEHSIWRPVIGHLVKEKTVISFDLPGHGRSLAAGEVGNAGVAARLMLQSLEEAEKGAIHLVGHSMGGAAACIIAMRRPQAVQSLTLLAPGAFGPEVNYRLLRRFAAAREKPELSMLLEQFFGWRNPVPEPLVDTLAEMRARNGQVAALQKIVETLFDSGRQKVLPLDRLAGLKIPIKVLWGTQDRVLPTRQAHKLPGRIAVHIFEGAGHMLPWEIADDVAGLILENCR